MAISKHSLVALVLAVSGISLAAIAQLSCVPATENDKSRFLLTFDPSAVVTRFAASSKAVTTSSSSGGSSSLPWQRQRARHEASFQWHFPSGQTPYMEIANALFRETKEALVPCRPLNRSHSRRLAASRLG